jgi:hypothetical protein
MHEENMAIGMLGVTAAASLSRKALAAMIGLDSHSKSLT